ncbi:uracil-DNA glycosylase [Sphingomonas sp. 35-24ZXX]|uniref:uracil-DNA glycosylase n=1 Tax=Sphingomonas sp. 35-24ZXX TaxID=1545915 RepID=UPI000AA238BE|nr:uracil-DNA glycosylase [Sphingomonas sp. 35-24ZXX]
MADSMDDSDDGQAAVRLDPQWRAALADEFAAPYMAELKRFLLERKAAGKRIFPPGSQWFRALDLTPPEKVRVVILGQDPYHGPGQAHGLCFSVQPGVPVPPSLLNIYKELERDLGIPRPSHGFLEPWAQQGVLLLNAVLTVEMGDAGSHQGRGWERFTDAVIARVNALDHPVAFLLWGSHAQKKAAGVDNRHLVLKAPHPSPLSAHRGFLGCGHFSQANAWLEEQGMAPIDWTLPEAP